MKHQEAAATGRWLGKPPEISIQKGGSVRPWLVIALAVLIVTLASPSGLSESLRGYTAASVVSLGIAGTCAVANKRGAALIPWGIGLFLAWAAYGATYSFETSSTVPAVIVLAIVALTAVIVAKTATLEEVLTGISIAGTASVFLSVGLLAINPSSAMSVIGLNGIYGHKNILGFVLALGVVSTFLLQSRLSIKITLIATQLVGVYLSSSSTAMLLAVLATAFGFVLLQYWKSEGKLLDRFVLVLAALLATAVGTYLALFGLDKVLIFLGKTPTLSARTTIWAAVEHYIGLAPLKGYGLGAVWTETSPIGAAVRANSTQSAMHAHNGYLDLVLQTGFVGAILFGMTLLVGLVRAVRRTVHMTNGVDLWPFVTLCLLLFYNLLEMRFFNLLGFFVIVVALSSRSIPAQRDS